MKRTLTLLLILLLHTGIDAQTNQFYGADRLNSSLITCLAQDADGLLWVGTEQGLSCFDGYRFVPQKLEGGDTERAKRNVCSLMTDENGRLWAGTAAGLQRRDTRTGRWTTIAFPEETKPRVSSLLLSDDGRLFVGTAGYGLYAVGIDDTIAVRLNGYAPRDDDDYFSLLWKAEDGSIWKCGANNRVHRRLPNGKIISKQTEGHPEAFYAHGKDVMTVHQPFTCAITDGQGNTYLGTRGSGLYWIPRNATAPIKKELDADGTINMNRARIEALLIDRAGNLWVGCYGRGLLMVPLHNGGTFHHWSFAHQGMATGSYVSSVAEGDNGATWCVVQGDGVYGFDKTGRVVARPQCPTDVESLYRDPQGQYFLGTADAVYAYSPYTGQWKRLMSTGGYRVNTMADIGKNQLAVSAFGSGLFVIDKEDGHVIAHETMHDTDTLKRGRLCNDWIHAMSTDSRGLLWLGTSSGVCCYESSTRSFASKGWRIMDDGKECTTMCYLANGKMLLGNKFPTTATTCYITEGTSGDLWVSTTSGLYHCAQGEETLGEPLVVGEFVQGAGLHSSDGRIILGMADGMLVFHPDSLQRNNRAPAKVRLTAFRLGGEAASPLTRSGGKPIMEQPVTECHTFSLAYFENNFQMEFSLLDFSNVAGTSFEYRMLGDQQWQRTDEGKNAISFNHLAPGTHRLQVRGVVAGMRTEIEEYVLEVRDPWWTSTTAYVIYSLLFLMAAGLAAWAYQRHVQHQMNEEKLRFLISAIHNEESPLTVDEMRKAVNAFVQSRKRQRSLYGDTAAVADRLETPDVRGNDEALMDRIIQSINRHLSDSEFSTTQLCTEAGISRAQLHRKMKELTGLPASEFIRGIRLEQAARLLNEQKLNITQVAYTVGFSTAAHFSTVFKKHFGVSPSEFVEQKKQK